jgi:DNA gyrase/topoisomerase IV subunit A
MVLLKSTLTKGKKKWFLVKGKYEHKEIDNTLVITEIPFSTHTRDYIKFLESNIEIIEKVNN